MTRWSAITGGAPPQPLRARLRLALRDSGANAFNQLVHHERGRYWRVFSSVRDRYLPGERERLKQRTADDRRLGTHGRKRLDIRRAPDSAGGRDVEA